VHNPQKQSLFNGVFRMGEMVTTTKAQII